MAARRIVCGVARFEDAGDGDMSWLSPRRYAEDDSAIMEYGGAVLIAPLEAGEHVGRVPYHIMVADDPRLAFFQLARVLVPPPPPTVRVHPYAFVHGSAQLGGEGFGIVKSPREIYQELVPHYRGVTIGAYCHVGALTCIDRGCLVDTSVGAGTFIDNLVHIAHGVTIGENCQIVAQAMIGGSVTIGDNVFVGGGAMVKNGVCIGDGAVVGLGAVVLRDVAPGSTVVGNPAKPLP